MRALLLLILGGGLIWAVLTFFPRSEAPVDPGADPAGPQGRPETPATDDRVGAGATGTSGGPAMTTLAGTGEASAPEKPAPVATPPGGTTGGPVVQDGGSGFDLPLGQAELAELGALVAHRGGVQDWLVASDDLLGADLERAVGAFDLILSGDRAAGRQRAQAIGDADALPGRVRWFLQRALSGQVEEAWPGNVAGGDPLELGMSMALRAHEAALLLSRQGHARAAELVSTVLVDELYAPWAASPRAMTGWTVLLDQAQARHLWHPKGDWPFVEMEVQGGDSLTLIRKRYLRDHPDRVICTGLIQRANGLSSDVIHPGQKLRVPTGTVTLLADLDAHWLLYLIDGQVAASWPVGIGAPGEETITGRFTIGEKEIEPTWWPQGRDPVYYGEEGNPLGTHYMTWFLEGQKTHYGFHGTWEPESIGRNMSEGCIRMHNEDVADLFEITPVGTHFLVQD